MLKTVEIDEASPSSACGMVRYVVDTKEKGWEMSTVSKRMIGIAVAAVLASSLAVLAGCSSAASSSASAGAKGSSAAASASSEAASAAASEESASDSSEESGASAGMANPWSEAKSAEEAAKGAGIDAFALPEGAIADLGEPFEITYRYMDGMAEATYEFPASQVTVRTAAIAEGDLYDISGDYGTYANEWTETIDNTPIACAGNRKGESTKTYWGEDHVAHSIVALGLGGDTDFGLTAERLAVFVEAMN